VLCHWQQKALLLTPPARVTRCEGTAWQVRVLSADVGRKEEVIRELRAKMRPMEEVQAALEANHLALSQSKSALSKARADVERKEHVAATAKTRANSGPLTSYDP